MKKGHLSNYFEGIAVKQLSAVEVNPLVSNQHEINGISSLKKILGKEKNVLSAKYIFLGEKEEDNRFSEGSLTWYDARENDIKRTEYRLYFNSQFIFEVASEKDLLVFGKRSNDEMIVIIVKAGTTYENNIRWLFNISDNESLNNFTIHEFAEGHDPEINYISRLILSELGIEIKETDENYLDLMISKFDKRFPSTKTFSEFSRNTLNEINIDFDPDQMLIEWMDREELLFRTFENYILSDKIKSGFSDVNNFIEFSLSIQNRRKARAGYAFENHFEQILIKKSILYSRGKETENRSKPDFIFPGIGFYQDENVLDSSLTMLGVKSTCKDRWRQILSEASRIKNKHLLTLEPGISCNQTEEMISNNVQLVVPQSLFATYDTSQQNWLININTFLELVKEKEKNTL